MENFNPSSPEYKKVEDLPEEHQADFVNVEGGFVTKEANENIERAEKMASLVNILKEKGITSIDVLQQEALSLDERKEFLLKKLKSILELDSRNPEIRSRKLKQIEYFTKDDIAKLPEGLRGDKDFILQILESGLSDVLLYASKELLNSKQFLNEAMTISESAGVVRYFSGSLRDDPVLMLQAAKDDVESRFGNMPSSLSYISERLKSDKQFVLEAVKIDGGLAYLSEFKDDKDVVLESVKKNGGTITSASPRLKNDMDVIFEAVKQNPDAIYSLPGDVQEQLKKLLDN
jgi:hypothetical protein